MELDELKTAWKEMDRKLEASVALNIKLLRELKVDKIRSAMRKLGIQLAIELGLGLLVALVVGSFIAHHLHEPKFLIPALMLQAVALVTTWVSVRDLALIGEIDYAAPVVRIQRQLASLQMSRTWVARWQLLLWPVLWAPAAVLVLKAFVGVDVFRGSGTPGLWFWRNVLVGVGIGLLLLWAAWKGAKAEAPQWLRRFSDDLVGKSLARASGLVQEIAQFEKEV